MRLTVDHPYHSLYHIYALANGNRDALGRRMQGHVRPGCTLYACNRAHAGVATYLEAYFVSNVQAHGCRQLTACSFLLL